MNELTADLFVSLDGFASGVDVGAFFGYAGPELSEWIYKAFDEYSAIVMGRKTYEQLAAFSPDDSDEVSRKLTAAPKIVFSKTLHEPLRWKNTRIASIGLVEDIMRLKREARGPIRTIGSLTLVRCLLQCGLIDRLRVMVFPVLLGQSGREPFHEGGTQVHLELVNSAMLDSRLFLLEYRPAR